MSTLESGSMQNMFNDLDVKNAPLASPAQTMSFEKVSPQTAAQWLKFAGTTNFRKLDLSRVARLADAIRATGWVNDGNAFKFNTKGLMIDGQHRASAIVKAGVTVMAWICRGVDRATTIDTGQSRTLSQFLRHKGEKNFDVLAATLGNIWRYKRNVISNNAATKITIEESLVLLEKEPEIRYSVAKASIATHIMSAAQIATLHYVVSRKDRESADKFVDLLAKGTELDNLSSIYHLRERMLRERVSKAKIMLHEKFALLITAWNLWYTGRPCKVLKWNSQGPTAQPFPQIISTLDEDVSVE